MTDHAAAVEAVHAWNCACAIVEGGDKYCHELRATLLRAYEAVVAFIAASGTVVQAGVDFVKNHADQLATLRAQHAAVVAECEGLRGELTDFLMRTAKARELQIMLDEQRAVLDAALAWEAAYDAYGNVDGPFNMDRAEEALYQAVRAYRAAKGGT